MEEEQNKKQKEDENKKEKPQKVVKIYKKVDFAKERKKDVRSHVFGYVVSLTIITICAGIGFSNLLNKYNKSLYVSKLRIGISSIEQGFKSAIASEGVSYITDTSIWQACNIKNIDENYEQCQSAMSKYFKDVKSFTRKHKSRDVANTYHNRQTCQGLIGKTNMWWHLNSNKDCSGWDNYTFYLPNKMKFDALMLGQNNSYLAGQLTVDVNGEVPPNRWGRDTFMFNILYDGTLIPYAGASDCKLLAIYTNNDNRFVLNAKHWKFADTCSRTTRSDGTACAARVIENSWEMDY